MSSTRIVTVFGATGNQGSSVVQRLLKDGTFTPRAITRDPKSAAALALQAQGAEVVKADMADKASLVDALRGSETVFTVTLSLFPPYSPENPSEIRSVQGLGTLSDRKYKSFLNDDKEQIEQYLQTSGVPNASLHLGSFAENLWGQHQLNRSDTGFTLSVPSYTPTARQAFTWVGHDVGEAALALLKNYTDPAKDISGKAYPVITAYISYPEFAGIISKALGKEVTFTSITTGIEALDTMFAGQAAYNGLYTTPVPNPGLVALGAKFGTLEEFVEMEVKKRFK
ncbi:hypothetical protein K438DRAFT_1937900 [Mycena galopus ATCC 62051]|nr:hypothetical protein K438DRAFT_1937900 [Mycena galopus ATCC 62051]